MGNLLKIFIKGREEEDIPNVYIDFENAQPTEEETEIYESAQKLVERSDGILKMIKEYGDIKDKITESIKQPSNEEVQKELWEALQSQMKKIKAIYDFMEELKKILPNLLLQLFGESNFIEELKRFRATMIMYSQIVDFCFQFDQIKLKNPNIQNELAHFRRFLFKGSSQGPIESQVLSGTALERSSLFLANSTPFCALLTTSVTETFVSNAVLHNNALKSISLIIKICRCMVEKTDHNPPLKKETILFITRIMANSIILFDHLCQTGAFSRNRSFDIRKCLQVIHDLPSQIPEFDPTFLLDVIKFSSKHIRDESTPSSLKEMLEFKKNSN